MAGRQTLTYAAGVHDISTTNSLMLGFRPILPKPSAQGAVSVGTQNAVVSKRRAKRKYVRVRRNRGYARKSGESGTQERRRSPALENAAIVTLQLLPEKASEPKQARLNRDSIPRCKSLDITEKIQILDNPEPSGVTVAEEGTAAPAVAVEVVESWVTVESATGTCMIGEGRGNWLLGCTDAEKVKALETDTCPGFVSDGNCVVRWVNEAYKKMVLGKGFTRECDESWPEVVVWLKVKDNAVWGCYSYPAFTCGVRLQYTWRNDKCTKMVPCDVWRLECGGFAWRLDVQVALGLGL